jgi:hypothetical protein
MLSNNNIQSQIVYSKACDADILPADRVENHYPVALMAIGGLNL